MTKEALFIHPFVHLYILWKIENEAQAETFNVNRRSVLPAVYNANLARYNWNPPVPNTNGDCQRQSIVNVKLEAEVTQLRETIVHLQNRIGAENLTTKEMADLQDELMDDDDFFEWLPNVPVPIGSIKHEREFTDDSEMSSMDNDNFVQAEDFGASPNATTHEIASSSNALFSEPIASTSGSATPSNYRRNLPDLSQLTSSSIDKVIGSIEFTTDVRTLCCRYYSPFIT